MRPIKTMVLCVAVLLAAAPCVLAAERWFLGEPWEQGIVRGVSSQRSAVKRGTSPAVLVGRAERNARRDKSVVKLYLLARAYGLRADFYRQRAARARKPEDKTRYQRHAREDHASSLATYREVLQQAPRCYFAYHDMGVMEMQREKPTKRVAFDYLSQAYRNNRNYTPTQRQLINLYLSGKQFAVAVPLLQRLVQLEPDDFEARRRLAVVLAETKQYDAAYRELEVLLTKSPGNPGYLLLRSQIDHQTGRYDRSLSTYQRLSRINPNVPTAFFGMLQTIGKMQAKGQNVDLNDSLYALKGLKRLERDSKRRAELQTEIDRVEHRLATPEGAAEGEPTTEQLLHALRGPEPNMRVAALKVLTLRKEKPTRAVLQAIAGHLSAKKEPSPGVRGGAIAALGRLSGSALIPLLRLALDDREEGVRAITADTLVGIASRDSAVAGPVIAILGTLVDDKSVEVSAHARHGILLLSSATLTGLAEDSDDDAHRKAFGVWWRGPEGESAQIDALDQYHRVGDKSADQVLVPYLSSPSFFVFRAAFQALGKARETAAGAAWQRWYGDIPQFPADRVVKENWAELKQAVSTWVSRRPGA